MYFVKSGLLNLTSISTERRKIDFLTNKMNLKNISKDHYRIMNDLQQTNNRFTVKLDHNPSWLNNS
jgi:hypothetical protein